MPHERSREQAEQLEEERRLMFVGITRAQQELQISLARYRDFRGQRKPVIPSSFLMELPRARWTSSSRKRRGSCEIDSEIDDLPVDHEPVFAATRERVPGRRSRAASPEAAGLRDRRRRPVGCGWRPRWLPAASGGRRSTRMSSGRGWSFCTPSTASAKSSPWAAAAAERTATIDFASAAGRKKLTLAGSPLRPVK